MSRLQGDGFPLEDRHSKEVKPCARPYQIAAHDAVWREFDAGVSSTLAVLPTGTGKTTLAAELAATARQRGLKTLFLAHRELLVTQAAAALSRHGLDTAVEMGRQDARAQGTFWGHADVVVGTVQSLQSQRLQGWPPDHFGLIVTDESHRAAAENHRNIYAWFQGANHVGLTATPDGASGNIGNVFQTLAYHYPIRQAVLDGWLVPIRHEKCKIPIDLKGIRTTGGDYNAGDLAERVSPQIEYIADGAKQRIGSHYAVAFTPDVGSALALSQALGGQTASGPGITARYVAGTGGHYGMCQSERRALLAAFGRREIQVLVCCELLIEGWNQPHVSHAIIARPTRLRYRYAQMAGRIMRPYLDKESGTIVDFDWQTDASSRDLVSPVELFAAEDPAMLEMDQQGRARVVREAREKVEQGENDPALALEEAKERERQRRRLPVVLQGEAARFEVEIHDPLEVGALLAVKPKRYDVIGPRYEAAKPWQRKALAEYGVTDSAKLSFYGASRLIKKLEQRKKDGLATWQQVHRLRRSGVNEDIATALSAEQAGRLLEEKSAG
jgi:superfamily II DNA or RNA helicase